MDREQKRKFVKEWSEQIKDVPNAVLVDFRGMTVEEANALRSRIRESESEYRVVKNNLAVLAVPGTPLEALKEHFEGPCAVAYNRHDPAALAKMLVEFSKDGPLEIKAGVLDGKLLEAGEIVELSKLPDKEELLGKLLYLMNHPIRSLAATLNAIVRNLAVVLAQVAKAKE